MLSAELNRGNREASGEESYGRFLYNRFRYYDPAIGRYVSADPIGQFGGVNVFEYAASNPIRLIDLLGLFDVIIVDQGGRSGPTFGGTATVIDNGASTTVPASSHPNPSNPNPGVASGTFPAVFSTTGHRGRQPGVRLRNGAPVPTLGPNPAQGGAGFATGINIHCGASPTNRGSAGCLTISPAHCAAFFAALQNNTTGTVTIIRPQPPAPNSLTASPVSSGLSPSTNPNFPRQ